MRKTVISTTIRHEAELLGGGHEHVTKISEGHDYVKGSGTSSEKSQEAASKKMGPKKVAFRTPILAPIIVIDLMILTYIIDLPE